MGALQKISIELSEEVIDAVQSRLASGEVESWNDLIVDALIERFPPPHESDEEIRRSIKEGVAEGVWLEGLPNVEDIHRRGMERLKRR